MMAKRRQKAGQRMPLPWPRTSETPVRKMKVPTISFWKAIQGSERVGSRSMKPRKARSQVK